MNRFLRFSGALLMAAALSGCSDHREDHDAILGRACLAGVIAMLPQGKELDHVVEAHFSPDDVEGSMRKVVLHTMTKDGWLQTEEDYECLFEEGSAFLFFGYSADIVRLKTPETLYGRQGDTLAGSVEDNTRLQNATSKAIHHW